MDRLRLHFTFAPWSAMLGYLDFLGENFTTSSGGGTTRADQATLAGEVFYPSVDVLSQALLQDWDTTAALAEKDLEGFWSKEAEELESYRKWDRVLDDSQQPFFKWFVGAQV